MDASKLSASISSLPSDLLALVFSFVREHRDLWSLSTTCVAFKLAVDRADLLAEALHPPARRLLHREGFTRHVKQRLGLWASAFGDTPPTCQVMVEGAPGSGKSALILQYVCNMFVDCDDSIEDSWRKQVMLEGAPGYLLLQIYCHAPVLELDGALMLDAERRRAHVHVVVYPIDSVGALRDVKDRIAHIYALKEDAVVVLCGTKGDRESTRRVTRREGRAGTGAARRLH